VVNQGLLAEAQLDSLGDIPSFSERLVVSPSAGRFMPLPPKVFTSEGEWVEVGQVLAEIQLNGRKIPVRSAHRGWLMSTLSLPGAPVTAGEALFCVRES
jgi:biotin carboxyl carrier protein